MNAIRYFCSYKLNDRYSGIPSFSFRLNVCFSGLIQRGSMLLRLLACFFKKIFHIFSPGVKKVIDCDISGKILNQDNLNILIFIIYVVYISNYTIYPLLLP